MRTIQPPKDYEARTQWPEILPFHIVHVRDVRAYTQNSSSVLTNGMNRCRSICTLSSQKLTPVIDTNNVVWNLYSIQEHVFQLNDVDLYQSRIDIDLTIGNKIPPRFGYGCKRPPQFGYGCKLKAEEISITVWTTGIITIIRFLNASLQCWLKFVGKDDKHVRLSQKLVALIPWGQSRREDSLPVAASRQRAHPLAYAVGSAATVSLTAHSLYSHGKLLKRTISIPLEQRRLPSTAKEFANLGYSSLWGPAFLLSVVLYKRYRRALAWNEKFEARTQQIQRGIQCAGRQLKYQINAAHGCGGCELMAQVGLICNAMGQLDSDESFVFEKITEVAEVTKKVAQHIKIDFTCGSDMNILCPDDDPQTQLWWDVCKDWMTNTLNQFYRNQFTHPPHMGNVALSMAKNKPQS